MLDLALHRRFSKLHHHRTVPLHREIALRDRVLLPVQGRPRVDHSFLEARHARFTPVFEGKGHMIHPK